MIKNCIRVERINFSKLQIWILYGAFPDRAGLVLEKVVGSLHYFPRLH